MSSNINPEELYTTQETRDLLKISESTMKRWIKKELIRAHKVGGRYRIAGKEILQLISPEVEKKASTAYQKIKGNVIKKINPW